MRKDAERLDRPRIRFAQGLPSGEPVANRADNLTCGELAVVGGVTGCDVGQVDDIDLSLFEHRRIGFRSGIERAEAGRIAGKETRYAERLVVARHEQSELRGPGPYVDFRDLP